MSDFPRMVYKDIEKDGDVSHPSNQRTVNGEAEFKAALEEGWRESPEDAVSLSFKKSRVPFGAH